MRSLLPPVLSLIQPYYPAPGHFSLGISDLRADKVFPGLYMAYGFCKTIAPVAALRRPDCIGKEGNPTDRRTDHCHLIVFPSDMNLRALGRVEFFLFECFLKLFIGSIFFRFQHDPGLRLITAVIKMGIIICNQRIKESLAGRRIHKISGIRA